MRQLVTIPAKTPRVNNLLSLKSGIISKNIARILKHKPIIKPQHQSPQLPFILLSGILLS